MKKTLLVALTALMITACSGGATKPETVAAAPDATTEKAAPVVGSAASTTTTPDPIAAEIEKAVLGDDATLRTVITNSDCAKKIFETARTASGSSKSKVTLEGCATLNLD